jgi:molybdenum-dependent DNA-binding transcriptional regulator ModE
MAVFSLTSTPASLTRKLITRNYGGKKQMKSNLRNEIKSYIVRQGMTMQEVVDLLHDEHGWSDSVSNLSNKLQRESLRYVEAVQLANAFGYEIVWQRKKR